MSPPIKTTKPPDRVARLYDNLVDCLLELSEIAKGDPNAIDTAKLKLIQEFLKSQNYQATPQTRPKLGELAGAAASLPFPSQETA